MFGIVAYVVVCAVAAGVLTTLYALLSPIRDRGEMRSWRVWMALWFVIGIAPYAWCEFATRKWGGPMRPAVEEVFDALPFTEGLAGYRVWTLRNGKAQLHAVGKDKLSWGGSDRPIVRIDLKQVGTGWEVDSYEVIVSQRMDRDGFILPPFW